MGEDAVIDKDDVLVGAIDQGTSSSRVLIFRISDWKVLVTERAAFDSIYPQEGWCEQDPNVILSTVTQVEIYGLCFLRDFE